jgi:putative heme-binding domain-containing protein
MHLVKVIVESSLGRRADVTEITWLQRRRPAFGPLQCHSSCRRCSVEMSRRLWLVVVMSVAAVLLPLHVESRAAATDISAGANLFRSSCAGCHGANATGARGPDLTRGTFRHAGDDAALFRVIANGIPGSPMPGALAYHSEPAVWQLVAYIRSLNRSTDAHGGEGDAVAGKRLFEERGRCLNCHLVNGRGACLGPDLSAIGRGRNASSLRLSLVQPNAEVDPAWWSVRLVDASGRTYEGRRMDEDTYSVRLLDASGHLRTFQRTAIRSLARIETSTMPGYQSEFTPIEIDDLVAYLSTLTRP